MPFVFCKNRSLDTSLNWVSVMVTGDLAMLRQCICIHHNGDDFSSLAYYYAHRVHWLNIIMMTPSNGNIFRVTGHLCGNYRSPVNSPHKGQWPVALMFSLICVWINGWVNNHKAGDLRRYVAHYDVTAMMAKLLCTTYLKIGYVDEIYDPVFKWVAVS